MEIGAPEDTPGSSSGRVIVVGAASRDLAADDPRGWRLGGAVSYASLALARLGFRVGAVIGVDKAAAEAEELALLRGAGVEMALVALARGPVFENVELPSGRVQRCLEIADAIDPSALPQAWRGEASAWFLGPVAAELSERWATTIVEGPIDPERGPVPARVPVALGWQGLLRTLEPGALVSRRAPARSRLIDAATLIGVSRDDLDPETSLASLTELVPGDATVALTNGERGGIVIGPGGGGRRLRRYPAIRNDGLVDATGAGDVFLATLLATRLDPQRLGASPARGLDVQLAAAAASLVVEAEGLRGVPELEAVLRRAARRSASN